MDVSAKIKIYLEKLRNLPEKYKKIILWTIVIILAIIMGIFWIKGTINKIEKLSGSVQNISLPAVNNPSAEISQEKNETEGWETYTNKDYNFEIKYPSDWTFREYDIGTGAALFPKNEAEKNTTGNGIINIGFLKRGGSYCKIPFEDYVKIAGPSEIQNYESLNAIIEKTSDSGVKMYGVTWNYTDMKGNKKISSPIFYINTSDELCGSIEVFLNDNDYADIYEKIISTFKFNSVK